MLNMAARARGHADNSMFRELLTHMMEDPRNIGLGTHLLFGAKNHERIGNHATNIAETVYFLVHVKAINDQDPGCHEGDGELAPDHR
jgi:hypothetical protein